MDATRLQRVLARIDELNGGDPVAEVVDGASVPRELRYSRRLSDWVLRLDPRASEPLRIAARGQHVRRWTIPRETYPMTRAGYLRWRETLKTFHMQTVASVMRDAGYDDATIERVRAIMSKRRLGADADSQTLEDALCLLFLEAQLADLRRKTPDDTMREVIRKTWRKMSPCAQTLATELPLEAGQRQFLLESLAAP